MENNNSWDWKQQQQQQQQQQAGKKESSAYNNNDNNSNLWIYISCVVGVSFVDYYYLQIAAHLRAALSLTLWLSVARQCKGRCVSRPAGNEILVRTLLLPPTLTHSIQLTHSTQQHSTPHHSTHSSLTIKSAIATTTTAACCRLWSWNEHINSRNCDYFGFIKRQVSKPNQTLCTNIHTNICINCTCVYLFNVACYKSSLSPLPLNLMFVMFMLLSIGEPTVSVCVQAR